MSPAQSEIRNVLVTGATGAIGGAIARRLAQDGFRVTVHCRTRVEQAQALCRGIEASGGQADWLAFDVTDREQARACLERQVEASLKAGAKLVLGGRPRPGPGYFYPPTLLSGVRPGMPAFDEELFGPVAAVIAVRDEAAAIAAANNSPYGLGATVFSRRRARARRVASQLEAGSVFINDFVRSDPTLPFGGIKLSGHGRELGSFGIREFVNIKTVWEA